MHALLLAFALAAPPETPKAKSPLDDMIANALKNHPDVRAAEAKKLLAEAELEQARLAITQKVSAAASRVEMAKAKLAEAQEAATFADKVFKNATVSELERAQYAKARPSLAAAKSELAAAELELQLLVGKGGAAELKVVDKSDSLKAEVSTTKLPIGPAIDKLEAAVLKSVKLSLNDAERITAFDELLKAAGLETLKVTGEVRLGGRQINQRKVRVEVVGEYTVAGWVELLLDDYHNAESDEKLNVYVREYGLLVEFQQNAPKDAITLAEFARAVRAKKK